MQAKRMMHDMSEERDEEEYKGRTRENEEEREREKQTGNYRKVGVKRKVVGF